MLLGLVAVAGHSDADRRSLPVVTDAANAETAAPLVPGPPTARRNPSAARIGRTLTGVRTARPNVNECGFDFGRLAHLP